MISQRTDKLNNPDKSASKSCSACQDLLKHMEQFFDIFETSRKKPASDWLTVDDIAKELRISKSIVYRFIRNGEIEAINIVENNGKIAQRGHYRIKRTSLNQYIESKKVNSLPKEVSYKSRSPHFPRVKNHLGL